MCYPNTLPKFITITKQYSGCLKLCSTLLTNLILGGMKFVQGSITKTMQTEKDFYPGKKLVPRPNLFPSHVQMWPNSTAPRKVPRVLNFFFKFRAYLFVFKVYSRLRQTLLADTLTEIFFYFPFHYFIFKQNQLIYECCHSITGGYYHVFRLIFQTDFQQIRLPSSRQEF